MTDDLLGGAERLPIPDLASIQGEHADADDPQDADLAAIQREPAESEPGLSDPRAAQDPTMDSVQTYLHEIGRVALLGASEEVELAERMARGAAAARRIEQDESLDPRLRRALGADTEAGQDAQIGRAHV